MIFLFIKLRSPASIFCWGLGIPHPFTALFFLLMKPFFPPERISFSAYAKPFKMEFILLTTVMRQYGIALLSFRASAHTGVGERWEHRLWRIQRPERVAVVGVQRSRTVGKAHTGYHNRNLLAQFYLFRQACNRSNCLL